MTLTVYVTSSLMSQYGDIYVTYQADGHMYIGVKYMCASISYSFFRHAYARLKTIPFLYVRYIILQVIVFISGLEQSIQKYLDAAKQLETFFLQKRLLLSIHKPEQVITEVGYIQLR